MIKWNNKKKKGVVVSARAVVFNTGIAVHRTHGEPDDKWFISCSHWLNCELDSTDLVDAKAEALLMVKTHFEHVVAAIGRYLKNHETKG